MVSQPAPVWHLPLLGFIQVWLGTGFIAPLREPGTSWSVVYGVLSALFNLICVYVLVLAARNCSRIWRAEPPAATWALVATALPTAVLCAAVATGPLTLGLWRWKSLIPALFALFLVVALIREVMRLVARRGSEWSPTEWRTTDLSERVPPT